MQKQLSIAFVWHMHQPNYQAQPNGIRLMPWARLHAIKDYLDMVLFLEKFPKLKLNFNLVPVLLDAFEDYGNKGAHDIHSRLTITPVEELTPDDKHYILNYFFDANYTNLISQHNHYNELYQKRHSKEEIDIDDFTLQEYSDIMMWFNIVWFDPIWQSKYPEITEFINKKKNFTLDDRLKLINIQRDIIKQTIPTIKKFQDKGQLEVTTSPYYHPVLPLLIDMNVAKKYALKYPLPNCKIDMIEDAKIQVKMALDRIEELFGKRPKGMWPSEQCISPKTLECFAELGIDWTISDEGILAKSIGKEFVRDFKGYLEDPYDLCNVYNVKTDKNDIKIIFRDSVIPNLIGFEYPHHDSIAAANDLYNRIKTIQNKLINSPDDSHLLTIAMDGENSWENYSQDGYLFLRTLYGLISSDESLATVLISDYIQTQKSTKLLNKVEAGSWINRDFQLWTAEPTKNLAWCYLSKTHDDLKKFEKEGADKKLLEIAKKELYIAEGSDWFWWYGEPNDSGQDHIFDYLFREHLKNIYMLLSKKVPKYLETPLISFLGKPSKTPKKEISPKIDGKDTSHNEWLNAGCIDIPSGPMNYENKLFNKIWFGSDKNNLYLRFDINPYALDEKGNLKSIYKIYIYLKSLNDYSTCTSPIRTVNKPDYIFPILKEGYTHEVKATFYKEKRFSIQFSCAIRDNLWVSQIAHNIKYAYDDIIEASIPFEDLRIKPGEKVDFFIINSTLEQVEEIYPQDLLLSIQRPE